MNKCVALIAIALTFFGAGAAAQISPCPDGIGIYFDLDASQFEIAYTGNLTPLNVYLLLTHPTGDRVLAWECRITETNTFTTPGAWALNGGLDVDSDPWDFLVGMEWMPVNAPVILLACKTMYGTATSTATYTVTGIPGSVSFPGGTPGYVNTLGFNTPMQVATGALGSPQACVNTDCGIMVNCDATDNDFMVASDRFTLRAVPNPFNPRTEIVLTLPRAGKAEVRIHDVQGRVVKRLGAIDGVAGENRITWLGTDERGRNVASGAYFAALYVDGAASGAVVRLSLVR